MACPCSEYRNKFDLSCIFILRFEFKFRLYMMKRWVHITSSKYAKGNDYKSAMQYGSYIDWTPRHIE